MELYAAIMSNNAEVVVTGAPFGSFRDIMQGVDLENGSVEMIGGLEERVLEVLLDGGVENAEKERRRVEGTTTEEEEEGFLEGGVFKLQI